MSTHHTLVVSDLHLADIEDHADGWKRHKGTDGLFDAALIELLEDKTRQLGEADTFTLVLNGDVFDFDLVTAVPDDGSLGPIAKNERRYGLDATGPKSRWKLALILDHHPALMATFGALVAAGHEVILIAGNHDRELCFPEVAACFVERVLAAAPCSDASVDHRARVRVEPWFHHVPGALYVEHGHQYDHYSSNRHNLDPIVELRGERHLALSTGNLSNRYLLSNIGTFNPHATDFILSAGGYLQHWFKHYALSRRSLVLSWLLGSIRALFALLSIRAAERRHPPRDYDQKIAAAADRNHLGRDLAKTLHDLARPPITGRFGKIVREYWIDRVLLSLMLTGATVALSLSPAALWVKLVVPLLAFPLAWFLYGFFVGDETALQASTQSIDFARRIAALTRAPVVVFGHTHQAQLVPLGEGHVYANTGTWAPSWQADGRMTPGRHNFVLVRAVADERPHVEVGSWAPLPLPPAPSAQTVTAREVLAEPC